MQKFLFLLIYLFSLTGGHAYSSVIRESSPSEWGTLIVSYQTGSKGERLDRVRFWLRDETQAQQMYPKGSGYVYDPKCFLRTVVIKDLHPGNYSIEFVVPNCDALFEEVPIRVFAVRPGSVTKIDQLIRPRYAILKAATTFSPVDVQSAVSPILTLKNSEGTIRAQSTLGKLVCRNLIPGTYRLEFEPLKGFKEPGAQTLILEPYEVCGPVVGTYILDPAHKSIEGDVAGGENKKEELAATAIEFSKLRQENAKKSEEEEKGYVHVSSNLPEARWMLYRKDLKMFSGKGSDEKIPLPAGERYRLKVDEIEGYTYSIEPSSEFSLQEGKTTALRILFHKAFGRFEMSALMTSGEKLGISIKRSDEALPLILELESKSGQVVWKSPPMVAGTYIISYNVPSRYAEIPPQKVNLRTGQVVTLSPAFVLPRNVQVLTNYPDASFTLKNDRKNLSWKGKGQDFIFQNLLPGVYTLSFDVPENKEFVVPPNPMSIAVSEYQDMTIRPRYSFLGKLTLHSDAEGEMVSVRQIGKEEFRSVVEIHGKTLSISVPQGHYLLTFHPGEDGSSPPPKEVEIKAFTESVVKIDSTGSSVHTDPSPGKQLGELVVATNVSDALFTVRKAIPGNPRTETMGHYRGKYVVIPLKGNFTYQVLFETLPDYYTPDPLTVMIEPGERKSLQVTYVNQLKTVVVPAGNSLLGDPSGKGNADEQPVKSVYINAFSIGLYPVTNAQYAHWLNKALQESKVTYIREADKKGTVIDYNNRLINKTEQADPYSQIAVNETTKTTTFYAIPGKEDHPVINVSWYGAAAFCRDNNCRLPTEAEWEKAAGVTAGVEGKSLKKYRYGFSKDTIDRTWANYKFSDAPIKEFHVNTTPVGFYNGLNFLPLQEGESEQQRTHLAKSTAGAFDMSGNVWEWVSDWYAPNFQGASDLNPQGPVQGTEKVAKGGCYDSLQDGVRVAERLPLPPEHADAFTGFRVVREPN
jgi:formylglycine-generating enzyme required for sulfatase activity